MRAVSCEAEQTLLEKPLSTASVKAWISIWKEKMVKKNKLKERLKKGEIVVGVGLAECRSPNIGQLFASAGFDWLFIDSEHSSFSISEIASLVVSCKAADIGSIFRVPSKESLYWITRYLDSGIQGLVIPHVETPQEVARVIKAVKYYPLGSRGMALELAHSDFQVFGRASEIMESANRETLIGIQIESMSAVKRANDLITEGIDFAFIGPWDLSQSAGIPGDVKNPKLIEAIRKVIKICREHGVVPGIAVGNDIDMAKTWIKEGMRMILVSSDIGLIVESGLKYTKQVRQFIKGK